MDDDSISLVDLNDNIGDCPDAPVKVAIIGMPGVGKSEFIQAILADGPAGSVEQNTQGSSTVYTYPTLPSVYMWELSAVESTTDEYLTCKEVDKYDFFLILCDTEFSEVEMGLAEQFSKRKKGFFFVRTKIDTVLQDSSTTDPHETIPKTRFQKHPSLAMKNSQDLSISGTLPKTLFQEIGTKFSKYPTFAISNRSVSDFEFPKLKTNLHYALISLKRFSNIGSEAETVKKYLESKLNEWKDVKINVGLVGESGAGKSSFINAVRSLHAGEEGAAEVGVTETTSKATCYPHPDNENVRFWDLPGVGSSNFPRKTYLKDIDVEIYDFFLIISARRFNDDDRWLEMELNLRKKSYFFVRTKFDQAVRGHTDKTDEFRAKIIRNIQSKINIPASRVYVISNVYRDRFDFPRLLEDIILAVPSLKKQSLAMTLCGYSENLIEIKKDALKPRLWKAAAMSGTVGAVPVPGIDLAVDLAIFVHEAKFYRKVFGLNEETLCKLAKEYDVDIDRFKRAMSKTGAMSLTKVGIKSALVASRIGLAFATKTGLTSVLEVVVPVIGSVISGGISFALTYGFLKKMLDDFASDAFSIYKLSADKLVADSIATQLNVL
ncbi:interferon-gamma-inducible GTPase 10-like [Liolophura sinensis]|uniref:interferon-gamma-inducible GTPase 10-like n=1 Tax=Liolophura sinensis TaxID=3198878 RepID=UPI00315934C4